MRRPFDRTDAPRTPFELPQYRLKASADNYMLAVVLFASALFFAGISVKFDSLAARRAILGLGWVLFLGTVIWLATFPVQLTT